MSATDAFFDSNVILYLPGTDLQKAARSSELLRVGGVVSVQVLNEVVRVTRSKYKFDWARVELLLATVRQACRIEPLTLYTHDLALTLAHRHHVHIFDANIIAAASLAGCHTLWSEDMQDGQVIGGLTIRNPYKS